MRRSKVGGGDVTAVLAANNLLPMGKADAPIVRAGSAIGTVQALEGMFGKPVRIAGDFVYVVSDDEEVPVAGDPYSLLGAVVMTTQMLEVESGLCICPNETGIVVADESGNGKVVVDFPMFGEVEIVRPGSSLKRIWSRRGKETPAKKKVADKEPALPAAGMW